MAIESLDPSGSLWDLIADDLRFWREHHNMSLAQVGRAIGVSKYTVGDIEHGRHHLQDTHAKRLDKMWELNHHFTRLIRFAKSRHSRDWLSENVDLEAQAEVIKIYEAIVVPGLLQTPDYARALLRAGANDVESSLNARIARQAVLERNPPPMLWVLLAENALDWPIGGHQTMHEQLSRLLETSAAPNISIRVVPRSTGAHPGLDGSFRIMIGKLGQVAYTESVSEGRLITASAEVGFYAIMYDRIGHVALPEAQSRDLIKKAMEVMK